MSDAAHDLLELAKKRTEERDRCRTDKMFLATVLGYDFQPDVHQELFDCYLHMDASRPLLLLSPIKDRLILWPRGHYKSTSITVEIIQLILNYPDIRIVLMRSTMEATQEWLLEILAHFTGDAEGSRLKELFPDFCGNKQELHATKGRFTTKARKRLQLREATVTVASATSNKTGKHFDVGCFDDLVTDTNSGNPKQIDKITKAFWMYVPLIEPGGYKYVTGTRYAHGDLYEDIIRKNTTKTWTVSVKNCWADDEKRVRFPQRVVLDVKGNPKPIGFTREGLLDIMQKDPAMFASQYLNRPAIEGNQTFTKDMLTSALVHPNEPPALSSTVLFVDLASTTEARSDDSVILAGQIDSVANVYVIDVRGDKWGPYDLALNIIDMSAKHRPIRVMLEGTAGSRALGDLVQVVAREKGMVIPIDYIKVDNKPDAKAVRIRSLIGTLARKRLKFFAGLPCWDKMVTQFTQYRGAKGEHDDYPDTVALMVNHFSVAAPAPIPEASRNKFISMLLHDNAAHEVYTREQDEIVTNGDMGSDFCC